MPVIHRDTRLVSVERVLTHASGDANHRHPRRVRPHVEPTGTNPLPDWIRTWPQLLGHPLVDDDDPRRVDRVVLSEETPRNERNAHGLEVAGRGRALVDVDELLTGRDLASLDRDRPPG